MRISFLAQRSLENIDRAPPMVEVWVALCGPGGRVRSVVFQVLAGSGLGRDYLFSEKTLLIRRLGRSR